MPHAPGDTLINRYRIVKLLGQGGFGAVYRAWDINLHRACAVKENLDTTPEAQQQFNREALILANLNHIHLARVIDYFTLPGQGQYLIMDFIEGEDLQQMLDRYGSLDEKQAVEWVGQICDALAYLHVQMPPIIHRDIKPANIKITPAGRAVLVDFGIAKVYDPKYKTTVGARAVTPGFSPFEQYGQAPTDHRTDIYALGATLYALLTGREPTESIARMAGVELVNPRALNRVLTIAIEKVILHALEVMPDQRFQSASAFKLALEAAILPQPPATVTAAPAQTVSIPAQSVAPISLPPPSRRATNPWLIWGTLGSLSVLVFVIVGILLSGREPQPAPSVADQAPTRSDTFLTPAPQVEPTFAPQAEPGALFRPLVARAPDCGGEYLGQWRALEALDEFTVRFTLCSPDPAFPAKIAFPTHGIYPAEWLERTGGTGDLLTKPVGSGPYRVVEWQRGEQLVLEAFTSYWGERARMLKAVIRWDQDPNQRYREMAAGNADGMDNLNPEAASEAEKAGLVPLVRNDLNIAYLGIINTQPPLDDERVRQALAMGLNRQSIVDRFYPPGSQVASHFTPCAVPHGCAGQAWYEFNPDQARQLLAEAGYPDGFELQLSFRDVQRTYLPQVAALADDLTHQLAQHLNIKIFLNVMESGEFITRVYDGNLSGLYLMGWVGDYPDVSSYLEQQFGESAPDLFGRKWPDIMEALREGVAHVEPGARHLAYEKANNLIRQHVPMIPLAHTASLLAITNRVQNFQPSPLFLEQFSPVTIPEQGTFTWLESNEPLSLYCADEVDSSSFRACSQIIETLLTYQADMLEMRPGLAEECFPDATLTEWTCRLRRGVKFHDGSNLDANDVVLSLLVQWDAAHPLHRGNSGYFEYFSVLWGGFLNQAP